MGSDGTASVQSGTLKLNEINQVVGLWDYGQGTDQAEADYEETAGAPYESDSYPEAFIGMLEDFYGNLEDSNTIWIASLDNHMYHDLSSNTIENTMIPQDYTGIIR